jgi:hypothetical protein
MDDDGGVASAVIQVGVDRSLFVLNPSISGALNLSGNAAIEIPGSVFVNSAHSNAVNLSGNSSLVAEGGIYVVGGVQLTENSEIAPNPVTGISPFTDPFAALESPDPVELVDHGTLICSQNETVTLLPGIYDRIRATGNCNLVLSPGVYYIDNQDFIIAENASISGTEVTIYLAGDSSFNLLGGGQLELSAPVDGPYRGVLVFQARGNTNRIFIGGNAVANSVGGTIYARDAQVVVSGNSTTNASFVVSSFNAIGNAVSHLKSNSTDDANSVTLHSLGQLIGGTITVSMESFEGELRQRFHDARTVLNETFNLYGIELLEAAAGEHEFADVRITIAPTSDCGAMEEGVLGCSSREGKITLISGWNWYAGSDPAAIGHDQYDFQTIITHELGHALGLSHSSHAESVMHAQLSAAQSRRGLTDIDLASLHDHSEPEALLALNFEQPNASFPQGDGAAHSDSATAFAYVLQGLNGNSLNLSTRTEGHRFAALDKVWAEWDAEASRLPHADTSTFSPEMLPQTLSSRVDQERLARNRTFIHRISDSLLYVVDEFFACEDVLSEQ